MQLASILATAAAVATSASAQVAPLDMYRTIAGSSCTGNVAVAEFIAPSSSCASTCREYSGTTKYVESKSCGVDFLATLQGLVDATPKGLFMAQFYSTSGCKNADLQHIMTVLPDGKCYPISGLIVDGNGTPVKGIKVKTKDSGYLVEYYNDQTCTKSSGSADVSNSEIANKVCIDNFIRAVFLPAGFQVPTDAPPPRETMAPTTMPTTKPTTELTTKPTTEPTTKPTTEAAETTAPPLAPVPAPSAASKMAFVGTAAAAVTGAVVFNALL